MATVILTAVGTAIGGPIGGALGALAGQALDAELFKPKGREGPRLTDLKLQTSRYGNPIPKVFGTMRVAGCVIWSTDLIETRSTSHRKGQPSTTTYSYAASFAVLLSARPVVGVGRIWADGNLLRGSAGDFKVQTGFRLHAGGEDQSADPLIASLEGAAPAHRGCAYAVFENLQLADFGNRIPSLSFELIADASPPGAGAIAAAVTDGLVADTGVAATIAGFAADGGVAREMAGLLANAADARIVAADGALAMTDAVAVGTTLEDSDYAAASDRDRTARRVAAIETVPRAIELAYYDAARDYQSGAQRARRPGAGTREERVELPAVLTPDGAKTLAERSLARVEAARHRRTIRLAADAAAIAPGAIVAVAGESGRWLVAEASLTGMVTELTLVRLPAVAPSASASGGRSLPAPDLEAGQTIVLAAELPAPGDVALAAPRLSVIAAGTGTGWRRAALSYSPDDGATWADGGATALPAIVGMIAVPPARVGSALADRAGSLEIDLARADMLLADADTAALDRGANLALAGDELLQFGRAESLGGTRWRLSGLWRGRRGTEAAAGFQAVGDRFALLQSDAVAMIDLPVSALGASVTVLASGVGDLDEPAATNAPLGGASVVPPAPVHLALEAGDEPALGWTRRSRLGFRWIDGGDAPLAEERERYRVTITAGGAVRQAIVDTPHCALLPGEAVTGAVIEVRQAGTLGESPPARLTLP